MHYLVATDGTDESIEAVNYAIEHAIAFDAALEIVHVVTPETKVLDDEFVLESLQDTAAEGRDLLDRVAERAAETATDEIAIETTLLTGRPADAIAQRAQAVDADAIFIGHRSLTTKQEEVVSSVAKSVVSKASVPVTVVR